ncbi:hypothetical protein PR048_000813 [Dryococelus australis]|uniref:DDE Tnp4 domain-containing protein n=1 Tax=Dryococelus australis TaxID=614101 RepID=A0ABQ9IH29_9NEOP|nr:hypothetical protein PR048_000813 [Dryococelus australis]
MSRWWRIVVLHCLMFSGNDVLDCSTYLASGGSFSSLALRFKMGKTTVAEIVHDICRVVCDILKDAVADADGRLLTIDIGTPGRQSNGGNFRTSNLFRLLETGKLDVPECKPLPSTSSTVPFVLLGDEGYTLLQLSRARNIVECAYGIMATKWRLLNKAIKSIAPNAVQMVKAICILHKFVLTHENDYVNIAHVQENACRGVTNCQPVHHRFTSTAVRTRDHFMEYFNSVGSVPWQEDYALPQNIVRHHNRNRHAN